MKIGDPLFYEGENWVLERIDPDPTRWQSFWDFIADNPYKTPQVTFRNVADPEKRIVFSKQYFLAEFLWNDAPIQH